MCGSCCACSRVHISLLAFVYVIWTYKFVQRPWCTADYKKTDCWSEEGIKAANRNVTDLEIVMPSYGQTGTSSVTEAVRELGFRAYHADDFSVLAKPVMFDRVDGGTWAETISRCRMQALSLEPLSDLLPHAVKYAPKAKFILTWRSFPSWAKSTGKSRKKELRLEVIQRALLNSDSWIPWIEMFDDATGLIKKHRQQGDPYYGDFSPMGYVYRLICNGYAWPINKVQQRGTYQCRAQEEAYLAHINEIRTMVPKERLFEFDVKQHGWDELEMFLFGRNSSRSRQPFPHPRTASMRTNEPLLENNWRSSGPAYFAFAVLHALNYALISVVVTILAELWGMLWDACASTEEADTEADEQEKVTAKARPAPVVQQKPPADSRDRRGPTHVAAAAIDDCPVLAVLEGVEVKDALAVGKALVEAGVRLLVVPLSAPGALESLQQLSDSLPEGAVVGAGPVTSENEVCAVQQAGGRFVISNFLDTAVLKRTKGLGLASFAGVCTPSEAMTALRSGADVLHIFPGQLFGPEALKAFGTTLPSGTRVLLTETDAISDLGAYASSGVCCFGASNVLFRPADAPKVIRTKAASFLKTCSEAVKGAGKK